MPTDTSLIGKAKELEVASLLIENGLYVFYPLVDKGYDLVVGNRNCTKLVPIQVEFRAKDPALGLNDRHVAQFEGKDVLLAYVIGSGLRKRIWLIPFSVWTALKSTGERADGLHYVTISRNAEALERYEGVNGVARLKEWLNADDE